MDPTIKERLKHILWIGGATDSGKSTIAQKLADRHKLSVFHYDKEDDKQVERLSQTVPEFQKFLASSMEDRWVNTTPKTMFDFLLLTFPHRFTLVVENLLSQPQGRPIIVEGFGLLPELVQPVLSSPYQAIWFVPTEKFKWESMTRRGKPSFASTLSDPDKARMNVFTRDTLLADYYRKEIQSSGYTIYEIDGTQSSEEMTDIAEGHFSKFIKFL